MRRLYIFGYDIYLLSIVIMIINLKYAQTYQTSTLTIYFKTFILHIIQQLLTFIILRICSNRFS